MFVWRLRSKGILTLTVRKAWAVYDEWLKDPRVDATFRQATEPFAAKRASKWIGDCYLLAYAIAVHAALVTFDAALHGQARKQGHAAIMPV